MSGGTNTDLEYRRTKALTDAKTSFADVATVGRDIRIALSSEYPLSEQRDLNTAGVTHQSTESQYRIRANASTESFESVDELRYVAGQTPEVGISIRVPTEPTGDQEIRWGYWDGDTGAYFGWDSTGLFVELQRGGTRQGKTYKPDWNGDVPNDIEQQLKDGVVTRLIVNLYNNGNIQFEFFRIKDNNEISKTVVHRESPRGQTTLQSQNLPVRVEVDNPDTSDYDVFVSDRQVSIRGVFTPEKRIKGDFRTGVSLSGTDWVPIATVRKKSGFDGISVDLFSLKTNASDPILVQVRSDAGSETDGDYETPANVNASETAVEIDKSPTASITDGYQRYQTQFTGGTGSAAKVGQVDDIDLETKRRRPVTFFARRLSGTGGTLNGITINWTERW